MSEFYSFCQEIGSIYPCACMAIELFLVSPMNSLISVEYVLTSPILFLKLVIGVFSHIFPFGLVRGLWILPMSSKKCLFINFLFCFPVFNYINMLLFFIIPFLLFALYLSSTSFLSLDYWFETFILF